MLWIDLKPLGTSRDFRILFTVRVLSLLGVGLATVAIPIQVYDLTASSLQVAAVGAVLGVGILAGTLCGGVLADLYSRRALVVWSRGLAVLVFAALTVNAALPAPQMWIIYACAAVNGATAFGQAAMNALAQTAVPREQLTAASALLALSTQVGAVVGPLIGGVLISAVGLFWLYAVTAAMILFGAALSVPLSPTSRGVPGEVRPWSALREGAEFMWRASVVRGVLLVDVAAMVFAMPRVLFPQLTDEAFGGSATVTGALYSASAVGAMAAALTSGWVSRPRRSGLVLLGSVALFGLATGLVGPAPLPLALVLLAVAGAADMVSEILRRSILTAATPDDLQGRVNGVWLAQAMVGPSLGGVEAGLGARLAGPRSAITLGGGICVALTALLGATSPPLRRVSLSGPEAAAAPIAADPGGAADPAR
ncbi:enterobactin transporter EntS [Actinoallomurus acaciae]|uniref:Enterobactin transporter EntS n=1 Tax=Actinoallomurus acaciae TaxID=502577 RepID=A0ABV5YDM0_9ACTN